MIIPTDGSHIVCPTCRGDQVERQPTRAMLSSRPDVHTLLVEWPCRACEGTGWLPPRHPKPDPLDDTG